MTDRADYENYASRNYTRIHAANRHDYTLSVKAWCWVWTSPYDYMAYVLKLVDTQYFSVHRYFSILQAVWNMMF